MSQVIIVSNRLPISVKKENGQLQFSPSIGGFAAPLASYVVSSKSQWIGWPGIASDELTEDDKQAIVTELALHNCSPVFLSQRQVDDFYSGYSNTVLWPLFHNLAQARNTASKDRERWWNAYRSVNKQYAQAALTVAETGSRIWVHDYQLLLVPGLLRAERADVIIGFFLHIPFPEVRTFSRLPEHSKLLNGVLGADVIGFHTPGYVSNFLKNSQAAGLATDDDNSVLLPDHIVRVDDFPMGIDYERYAGANKSKAVKAALRKYRKRYKGRRVIVAVDRLDPIKGLAERLEAYGTFLELHPRMRGKIVFSMVAAPSRTDVAAYKKLSKRLTALVGEINTKYGTPNWQPVDYMNVSMPFEDVTALFRIADVAFIAPIRDGMNLAAKEFVASKRKAGVLILSRTAGAAEELPDAILVNPRRQDELVDALEQALTMRKRELKRRLRRMQQHLSVNTVQGWTQSFIDSLQQPLPRTPAMMTYSLRGKTELSLLEDYRQSKKRLLLLDYDGSLVPFTEDYKDAKPPRTLVRLLETVSANPLNEVVLISGRSPQDLEGWFGELPVNLVAEHGAAIKKASGKSWQTIEKIDTKWKKQVGPILDKYANLTPGARVEIKPHSLVWHYRAASPYYAQKHSVAIKRLLKPLLKTYKLELLQGNKVLEVKNPLVSKGNAAKRWLKQNRDFVLAIGDDMTDEDLFAVLPPHGHSIKIGHGRTLAKLRLPSYKEARALLKKFI